MRCLDDQSLALWLSGRLSVDEAAEATRHLEQCADCRLLSDVLRADAQPRVHAVAPGQSFGPYVVLEWVGKGGMGDVFAAWDGRLDRKVALKVLQPSADTAHALQEARAMARLDHASVATVFEAGEANGSAYLAMEFLSGGSLRTWLAAPRRLDEVLQTFARIARGLHHAHSRGVVHRDFKPENVVFGANNSPRITDFGLAAHTAIEAPSPPTVVGTVGYLAPEVLRGEPATAAADQYSFGVALRSALRGIGADSRALRAVVEKTLQANPLERFASMRDVAQALTARRPKVMRRTRVTRALAAAATLAVAITLAVQLHRRARCDVPMPAVRASDSFLVLELQRQLDEWQSTARQSCLADEPTRSQCARAALSGLAKVDAWPELLVAPAPQACQLGVDLGQLERAQALALGVLSSGERCPDEAKVQQALQTSRQAHLPAEASLWAELGECRVRSGRLNEAIFLASLGQEVARTLPPQSLPVLDFERRRVRLLLVSNRADEAETLAHQLVQSASAAAGAEHWFTAFARVSVAEVRMLRGAFEEVAQTYQAVLPALEAHFGPSDVRVLRARHNHGAALLALGRYQQAWDELHAVLEQRPERPTPLTSDLAQAALGLRRYDDALALGRESIRDLAERDVRVFALNSQQFIAWGTAELAAYERHVEPDSMAQTHDHTVLRGAPDAQAVLKRTQLALEVEPLSDVHYDAAASIRLLQARALRLLGRRDEAVAVLQQTRRGLANVQQLVPVAAEIEAELVACAD